MKKRKNIVQFLALFLSLGLTLPGPAYGVRPTEPAQGGMEEQLTVALLGGLEAPFAAPAAAPVINTSTGGLAQADPAIRQAEDFSGRPVSIAGLEQQLSAYDAEEAIKSYKQKLNRTGPGLSFDITAVYGGGRPSQTDSDRYIGSRLSRRVEKVSSQSKPVGKVEIFFGPKDSPWVLILPVGIKLDMAKEGLPAQVRAGLQEAELAPAAVSESPVSSTPLFLIGPRATPRTSPATISAVREAGLRHSEFVVLVDPALLGTTGADSDMAVALIGMEGNLQQALNLGQSNTRLRIELRTPTSVAYYSGLQAQASGMRVIQMVPDADSAGLVLGLEALPAAIRDAIGSRSNRFPVNIPNYNAQVGQATYIDVMTGLEADFSA